MESKESRIKKVRETGALTARGKKKKTITPSSPPTTPPYDAIQLIT